MKTGQVMQQFGIKRDTLRFYTEQGLLQPQLIDGNYYWNEEEINNLENILGLRQLGLSVKAIIRIKDLHDTKCGSLEQLKKTNRSYWMKLPTVINKSSCSKNRRKI